MNPSATVQTPRASPAEGVGAAFRAEVEAPHDPSLGTAVDRTTPPETIGPGEPATLLRLLLGDVALGPAQALLERFGSLRRLAAASAREVEREGGIAPETAARLAAAFQLGRLAHAERMRRDAPFRSSRDIFERFHPLLRDLKKERFLAVLVDGKNRVIREDRVSEGSLTSSLVHPREVFGPALREGAANILFVHNHPSGDPEPSPEDHDITARLCAVGELLGIRVLDHLVIGDGVYVSFLDRGWV